MTNPIDQPREPFPDAPGHQAEPVFEPMPAHDEPVAPDQPQAEVEPKRPAPGFDQKGRVRRTRVSGVWIGLIGTALFLILLIVFIAQNSRQVPLHFFGWSGNFSLALTIVLSAVIGVLLVAIPGSVRILQLRRALHKNVPGGTTGGLAPAAGGKRHSRR